MVKEDKNLTGNAKYEGFCIDLLKWIASQVGFQYSIRLVPDHMYGVYDPDTKEWNGIVRELMEKVGVDIFRQSKQKLALAYWRTFINSKHFNTHLFFLRCFNNGFSNISAFE